MAKSVQPMSKVPRVIHENEVEGKAECAINASQDTCSGALFVTSLMGKVTKHNGSFYLSNLLTATCGTAPIPEKLLEENKAGQFCLVSPQGFSGVEVDVHPQTRWVQRLTFHRNGNLPSVSVGAAVSPHLLRLIPVSVQPPRRAVRVISKHEECKNQKILPLTEVQVFYEDERKNVVTEQGVIVNATRKPLTRNLPSAPPKPLPPALLAKPPPQPKASASQKERSHTPQAKTLPVSLAHQAAAHPSGAQTGGAHAGPPAQPDFNPHQGAARNVPRESGLSSTQTYVMVGMGAALVLVLCFFVWRSKQKPTNSADSTPQNEGFNGSASYPVAREVLLEKQLEAATEAAKIARASSLTPRV